VSQSLFDHFAPYAEEILKQLSIIRLREIRERESDPREILGRDIRSMTFSTLPEFVKMGVKESRRRLLPASDNYCSKSKLKPRKHWFNPSRLIRMTRTFLRFCGQFVLVGEEITRLFSGTIFLHFW